MALSKELKQVVEAAYSGMTISDDWTQAKQTEMIRDSERLLDHLITTHDHTPRNALERIFVMFSPDEDPGRAGWFMSRATPKAAALGVDLDEKQDIESLLKRLEHGAASLLGSSSDDTSEPKDKPKHKSNKQPKAAPPID